MMIILRNCEEIVKKMLRFAVVQAYLAVKTFDFYPIFFFVKNSKVFSCFWV